MQIKLELFSPKTVSTLENKELLSHSRVYRKDAKSAQTDGRITTDLYALIKKQTLRVF